MAEFNEQESEFLRLLHGMPCDDASRPDAAARLRGAGAGLFRPGGGSRGNTPFWWKHAYEKERSL